MKYMVKLSLLSVMAFQVINVSAVQISLNGKLVDLVESTPANVSDVLFNNAKDFDTAFAGKVTLQVNSNDIAMAKQNNTPANLMPDSWSCAKNAYYSFNAGMVPAVLCKLRLADGTVDRPLSVGGKPEAQQMCKDALTAFKNPQGWTVLSQQSYDNTKEPRYLNGANVLCQFSKQ